MARITDNRMEWFEKEANRLLSSDIKPLLREVNYLFQMSLGRDWPEKYNLREIAEHE